MKTYTEMELKVVLFSVEDVVRTSVGGMNAFNAFDIEFDDPFSEE